MRHIAFPTSASFLVSENCNLACKYCFELKKINKLEMTEEVAIQGLNFLFENSIKNGNFVVDSKEVSVTLFGGEPMMNPRIIDTIMSYGHKLMESTGITFNCSTITNGTMLSDETLEIYKKHIKNIHVSIQISVDGIREKNDINRVTKSGEGSFHLVEKNISKFKEIFGGPDFFKTDKRQLLHVHGSLNNYTMPYMHESYKFFNEEWNIPAVWFMPIHGDFWTKDDAKIYNEQLNLIADDIMQKIEETNSLIWLEDYAPLNKALTDEDQGFGVPCGAGRSYCTVTADGSIYPCHQFYFMDDSELMKTGDIWKGIDYSKTKLFLDYTPDDMYCTIDKKCTSYNCYRCIADYYTTTGSILSTHYNKRCNMSAIENFLIKKIRKFIREKKDLENHNYNMINSECAELEPGRLEKNIDDMFGKLSSTEESF